MGCCVGIKNQTQIFSNNDITVSVDENVKRECVADSRKSSFNKEKNWKKNNRNPRKISMLSMQSTNLGSPIRRKKYDRVFNTHKNRVKNTVKILKLIAITEVKNIHKFFVLK
jgi:hypothetical protein